MIYSKEEIDEKLEKYTTMASSLTGIADADRHFDLIKPYIELAFLLGKAAQVQIDIARHEFEQRKAEVKE